MPWSNQGGGPWGSGKGPWGSGPQQKGPTPPDLEEMLRRGIIERQSARAKSWSFSRTREAGHFPFPSGRAESSRTF